MNLKETDYEETCPCNCLNHYQSGFNFHDGYTHGNDYSDVFNADDVAVALSMDLVNGYVTPILDFTICNDLEDMLPEGEKCKSFDVLVPVKYCPLCGRNLMQSASEAQREYEKER